MNTVGASTMRRRGFLACLVAILPTWVAFSRRTCAIEPARPKVRGGFSERRIYTASLSAGTLRRVPDPTPPPHGHHMPTFQVFHEGKPARLKTTFGTMGPRMGLRGVARLAHDGSWAMITQSPWAVLRGEEFGRPFVEDRDDLYVMLRDDGLVRFRMDFESGFGDRRVDDVEVTVPILVELRGGLA